MQLVDTHVHLNFPDFQDNLEDIARNWREAGVVRLVHSCVTPNEFDEIRAIANRFPEISFAVGLHPLDVADHWSDQTEADIRHLAQLDSRVVAIGETGLDFFKADNQPQQCDAFIAQLKLSRQLGLPVIIHCRDAAKKMAELLRDFCQTEGPLKGVMHCWSGTPEETQWFLDLGFHISFSGIVTFKNALQVHESAKIVPDNRLLIETDCPFLSPAPHRGKRPNQPAFVRHVADRLAQLRGISLQHLAEETTFNARQLFQLMDTGSN